MQIRPERAEDIDAIRQLTNVAFSGVEHSRQTEAAIVDALREAGVLAVSLVAVDNNEVVGHVAFSPITIDGKDQGWYGLGPVAVRPDYQRRGIGNGLINKGLELLAEQGAAGCVVLGEPTYYQRFGFARESGLYYEGVPAEFFLSRAFSSAKPAGRVDYHDSFNAR